MSSCPGCQTNELNQVAHMDPPNGCLFVPIGEPQFNFLPRNLEEEFEEASNEPKVEKKDFKTCVGKPIFALPCNIKLENCAICLDDILEMVNITVTTCGHTFHSSCMFESIKKSADCPLCRNELLEYDEEDEDSEFYEEDAEIDSQYEDDEEENDEAYAGLRALFREEGEEVEEEITVEKIATKLQSMGYTLADFIKLEVFPCLRSTNEARYTEEFEEKMEQDIDDIASGKISIHVEEMKVELVI
jgi:hypothetical protein